MPYAASSSRRTGTLSAIIHGAASFVRAWPALPMVVASLALSLLSIYLIDVASTRDPYDGVRPLAAPAARQALYLLIAIAASLLTLVPRYRRLGAVSWALLGISVLLLIFLLIPGVPASIVRPRNGARSWIDLGVADFQPSEVAKIAYVLVLAWYLRFRRNHRTLSGLLPPAIITFIPVGLIMLQPDLGTAVLFIPALFAVLVAAGAKLRHLFMIVLIATLAAPAVYPILKPHQKQRIVGLILQVRGDTSADQDINMQSVTSQRLVGAGGSTGVGDAHSRMLLHYNALPERRTDMIFAVACNRFGWLGGLAIFALYGLWALGAIATAAACREPFGRLACVGLLGFIGAQVFINIGMNLGIVPIVGITLPYMSFGGSSMLTVWIMTGLIVNIAWRRPRVMLRKPFVFDDD
jgi:rod shape determining protein RodA